MSVCTRDESIHHKRVFKTDSQPDPELASAHWETYRKDRPRKQTGQWDMGWGWSITGDTSWAPELHHTSLVILTRP